MGRGESAQPAHLSTLPALRGGKGGDHPRPLSFYSAVLRALGLPTLALPMNGEGRNCPTGSSKYPPRFAGREGWGRPVASFLLLGCIEGSGPPHPGPPHEWGGEKVPNRLI